MGLGEIQRPKEAKSLPQQQRQTEVCPLSASRFSSPAFVPSVGDAEMTFMAQVQGRGWAVIVALLLGHCQQGQWQCPNHSISDVRLCLWSPAGLPPCFLPFQSIPSFYIRESCFPLLATKSQVRQTVSLL